MRSGVPTAPTFTTTTWQPASFSARMIFLWMADSSISEPPLQHLRDAVTQGVEVLDAHDDVLLPVLLLTPRLAVEDRAHPQPQHLDLVGGAHTGSMRRTRLRAV